MCGIVGLLVKKPALRRRLGEWMVPMLIGMTERGPESAGLAVFGNPVGKDERKISLYSGMTEAGSEFNWSGLAKELLDHLDMAVAVEARGNHAVLTVPRAPEAVRRYLREHHRKLHVLSVGRSIDLFKDVGTPAQVAERYAFDKLSGSHLVGHTRMATESAVTPDRAHPFTAGEDFCLVHNGSLSNPNGVRRKLESEGVQFDTDNDTEGACRFLEFRLREGDTLTEALHKGFEELDGFYTFLMGTADQLALIRDPFACKPALVAENDDYVAIASEFRSLAHLPDIKNAKIFEPAPEEMYIWQA
ncbi:MAG: amidophosphoribosyltransferase [Burkholderiales bacterium]|nr:amidophosphoribosyltransferase [Burkholderiales bacterium]MDE1925863.1 amidophosphoribosyltransferase [Burkholderiales bacterium]MDE2157410.1 amidophosphoribosyltransferase [Burkholderiales bacterium]MDE2503074.1 amidophosphoribosyltransferase [Burkholderiales bacterium]